MLGLERLSPAFCLLPSVFVQLLHSVNYLGGEETSAEELSPFDWLAGMSVS